MIDKELRERSLNAPARGDAAPREKILKLGKKITTSCSWPASEIPASTS